MGGWKCCGGDGEDREGDGSLVIEQCLYSIIDRCIKLFSYFISSMFVLRRCSWWIWRAQRGRSDFEHLSEFTRLVTYHTPGSSPKETTDTQEQPYTISMRIFRNELLYRPHEMIACLRSKTRGLHQWPTIIFDKAFQNETMETPRSSRLAPSRRIGFNIWFGAKYNRTAGMWWNGLLLNIVQNRWIQIRSFSAETREHLYISPNIMILFHPFH